MKTLRILALSATATAVFVAAFPMNVLKATGPACAGGTAAERLREPKQRLAALAYA